VNKDVILYQADYFSNNYDYVAIVDWDHGVVGYPDQSPYELHYLFEDDLGTVIGTPASHYTDFSNGVFDIDIYNAFPPAKVHFAFIDACLSADLDDVGQGFHPNDSLPLGMPFAFTHRYVGYVGGGYSGPVMSVDGYNSPDTFPQCYIGFPFGSAALDQQIDKDGDFDEGGPYWYEWVVFFFYFALNQDISVNDALDMASWMQWQCDGFLDSPLVWPGFTAVWPMDTNGDGIWEYGSGQQGLHSTLAVYGNGNIHLKNFSPSDMVTWPAVGGPTTGEVDVSYEFGAQSFDSHGHDIRYTFDWDDGSQNVTDWCSNGDIANMSHTWSTDDVFSVRVKAQCSNGVWSSWSIPHNVIIGDPPELTVYAYDQYENPLEAPLYIDGNYVGTTGYSYTVSSGDHWITVEDTFVIEPPYAATFDYYYYAGDYYYDIWLDVSLASDKTVIVYYYGWY